MKGAELYENEEKVLKSIALKQFYKMLLESMCVSIQDKTGVDTFHKAANLADEYSSRRGSKKGMAKPPGSGKEKSL